MAQVVTGTMPALTGISNPGEGITEPGKYTVTLTCGSVSESTTGAVPERWRWPVLNYRGDGQFGISDR